MRERWWLWSTVLYESMADGIADRLRADPAIATKEVKVERDPSGHWSVYWR